MSFVHLHVHTHFSLLDSTVKVPSLCKRTAELGMSAVAVTDHGNLYGAIEFQSAAKKAGIRPIYGCCVWVVPTLDVPPDRRRPCQLVLLARDLTGYRNLMALNSGGWLRELDRDRPVVDHSLLARHAEGLIALSGDLAGEIPQEILRGRIDRARELAELYRGIFGADGFYLELQRHPGLPESFAVTETLVALSEELDIPVVATNSVHYLHAHEYRAHAVLMAIGLGRTLDVARLDAMPLRTLHLASVEEMAERFVDLPIAIENSVAIAARCDVVIPTGHNFLPKFPVPDGETEVDALRRLSHEGLRERFVEVVRAGRTYDEALYLERLEIELSCIIKMDFPGYFLIVQDFINWAKRHDIPVGPGRGSGAGSLVAWALRITDIDPIPYGLLFERFLNPERVSMPDFDIDFCQSRRDEVIQYVVDAYGRDSVAGIIALGQLKPKAVLKDIARVLRIPIPESERVTKMVPGRPDITLAKAFAEEQRLAEVRDSDDLHKLWFELAFALEGCNRNVGVHAAGIVIAPGLLWEYVPIRRDVRGEGYISQFAKNEVEAAGLVKFDFLGLKNLTVIKDALTWINRERPADDPLDFQTVRLDEPKVYETLSRADTVGIFQLESSGFRELLTRLKPDCIEDIIAAVALYRPGPIKAGMVSDFVERKHGRSEVSYPHPLLEELLRETYGVMVYQEQVMQCAQILAGYSLGGADLLRRAMGKKDAAKMAEQRAVFVEGAVANAVDAAVATDIFNMMEKFAEYGFNKSHSAAYGMVTYQTAYLKALYPRQFYAALMTNDAGSTEKLVRYITDARAHGILVLPPDVNESDAFFSVAPTGIRFGMLGIKGVGEGPLDAIRDARTTGGPFTGVQDLCDRVDRGPLSKKVAEALVGAGACDALHPDHRPNQRLRLREIGRRRAQLHEMFRTILSSKRTAADLNQVSLFDLMSAEAVQEAGLATPDVEPWDADTVLLREKETLGLYVSGHPLDGYRDLVREVSTHDTESLLSDAEANTSVRLAGVLRTAQRKLIKGGAAVMYILELEDLVGIVDARIFPKAVEACEPHMERTEPLLFIGRPLIDEVDDQRKVSLAVERVVPMGTLLTDCAELLTVDLSDIDEAELDTALAAVRAVLVEHPGQCGVELEVRVGQARARVALPAGEAVEASEALRRALERIVDAQAIRFRCDPTRLADAVQRPSGQERHGVDRPWAGGEG